MHMQCCVVQVVGANAAREGAPVRAASLPLIPIAAGAAGAFVALIVAYAFWRRKRTHQQLLVGLPSLQAHVLPHGNEPSESRSCVTRVVM